MPTYARYAHKQDKNQWQIVAAFREAGAVVAETSGAGKGFPDLVVGTVAGLTILGPIPASLRSGIEVAAAAAGCTTYAGANLLVEVKDGDGPPSRQRLTDAKARFHRQWRGPLLVVTNTAGAKRSVGVRPMIAGDTAPPTEGSSVVPGL